MSTTRKEKVVSQISSLCDYELVMPFRVREYRRLNNF